MVLRTCQNCAGAFSIERFRANRGEGLFCSRGCYSEHRSLASPERFWVNLDKLESGCWKWKGTPMIEGGYGRLRIPGGIIKAHRWAWQLINGAIPDGMMVCHTCDNPICVNPEHLFLGTAYDNMRDMADKGRAAGSTRKGEAHPMALITWEQAREMRRRYGYTGSYKRAPNGVTQKQLAEEFGVNVSLVRAVVTGDTWKEGSHTLTNG